MRVAEIRLLMQVETFVSCAFRFLLETWQESSYINRLLRKNWCSLLSSTGGCKGMGESREQVKESPKCLLDLLSVPFWKEQSVTPETSYTSVLANNSGRNQNARFGPSVLWAAFYEWLFENRCFHLGMSSVFLFSLQTVFTWFCLWVSLKIILFHFTTSTWHLKVLIKRWVETPGYNLFALLPHIFQSLCPFSLCQVNQNLVYPSLQL